MEGNDVFGVLPTGYGKSLCCAVLPDLLDTLLQPAEPSIVVIVTPLTAIMDDQVWLGNSGFELRNTNFLLQVKGFLSKGLLTAAIHRNASEEVKEGVRRGAFVLVFFTPELLLESKRWRRLLQTDHYTSGGSKHL